MSGAPRKGRGNKGPLPKGKFPKPYVAGGMAFYRRCEHEELFWDACEEVDTIDDMTWDYIEEALKHDEGSPAYERLMKKATEMAKAAVKASDHALFFQPVAGNA